MIVFTFPVKSTSLQPFSFNKLLTSMYLEGGLLIKELTNVKIWDLESVRMRIVIALLIIMKI